MQAGPAAGLSDRLIVTALRVGNVPKDEFERQVEAGARAIRSPQANPPRD
jgi:hypothetical protein